MEVFGNNDEGAKRPLFYIHSLYSSKGLKRLPGPAHRQNAQKSTPKFMHFYY